MISSGLLWLRIPKCHLGLCFLEGDLRTGSNVTDISPGRVILSGCGRNPPAGTRTIGSTLGVAPVLTKAVVVLAAAAALAASGPPGDDEWKTWLK